MATLERPKVETRTPEELVHAVRAGEIRIPTFQRGYRWDAADVVKLFDSLFLGYPVGNLLLWQRPAPEQKLRVGPLDVDAPQTPVALWVVDGQQRITSLVGALVMADEAADTRFRVHFDLDTGQFHTSGVRQNPPRTWVPVNRLLDSSGLNRWIRSNPWLSDEQEGRADAAAKAIREYQIPVYLVRSDDEEPLVEIFNRMNTQGKPLTKAEVFQALHSDLTGGELIRLADVGAATREIGFGVIDDNQVLRCVLAYRGGDMFRDDYHGEFASEEDRAETFRGVSSSLREAADFLRDECGIPHIRLLPYSHVIPILVRFVRLHGSPDGRAATLLRRWVWRTSVCGSRVQLSSPSSVRKQARAVEIADPVEGAAELLAEVPGSIEFAAELDKVNLNSAMAKVNVLCMITYGPSALPNGPQVDVRSILESGATPLAALWDQGEDPAAKLANRVIAAPDSSFRLRLALSVAPPEIAFEHFVNEEMQAALQDSDATSFLDRRARLLARAIETHVDDMAEWGARDGRGVGGMMTSAG